MKISTLLPLFLVLLFGQAKSQSTVAPRIVEEAIDILTNPSSNATLALFPASTLSMQTPIQVYFVTVMAMAVREPFAACDPVALSFFGTNDKIPSRFCKEPALTVVYSYTLHRTFSVLFPEIAIRYARVLTSAGLNPHDRSTDMNTEVGWANVIADRLIRYFKNDGWNILGDSTSRFNRKRFEDTTGYKPVNPSHLSPHNLRFPLRWQPLTMTDDQNGNFFSQTHVVPHIGETVRPFSESAKSFDQRRAKNLYEQPNRAGSLSASDERLARHSLRGVWKRSRSLTLEKVVISRWWDSKFLSLGFFSPFYDNVYNASVPSRVHNFAAEMMALHDAVVLAWREKRRHDLVRPVTLMRRLFPNKSIVAWRGLGDGVGKINSDEWEPAVPTMPHSEYPSGSALMCSAALEQLEMHIRDISGGDKDIPPFEFQISPMFVGLSGPDVSLKVKYNSLKEAAMACGESRLDVGVHFPLAVKESNRLAKGLGAGAYRTITDLNKGVVPSHCHWCIRN